MPGTPSLIDVLHKFVGHGATKVATPSDSILTFIWLVIRICSM